MKLSCQHQSRLTSSRCNGLSTVNVSSISAPCRSLSRFHQQQRSHLNYEPHHTDRGRVRTAATSPVVADKSLLVTQAQRFLDFSDSTDLTAFKKVASNELVWRRFSLAGCTRHTGAAACHAACQQMHKQYQDLAYTVNSFAAEQDKLVVYWTASGVNRVGLYGHPPTFKRSTFSGVSVLYADSNGLLREVVEFRQPTGEEATEYLIPDMAKRQLKHLKPCIDTLCLVGSVDEHRETWKSRAVEVCTEWVESWTASPDLEQLVRDDVEEFNRYSWPDFEANVEGPRAVLAERFGRSASEAVYIHDTIADPDTSLVGVYWSDWRPAAPPTPAATAVAAQHAAEAAAGAARAAGRSPTAPAAQSSHPLPGSSHGNSSSSSSGLKGGSSNGMGASKEERRKAVPEGWSQNELPRYSMPTSQPQLDAVHGSVEVTETGQFRVRLSGSSGSSSDGNDFQPVISHTGLGPHSSLPRTNADGQQLFRYSGVTLFQLDVDCRIAWIVAFRELTAEEAAKYLKSSAAAETKARAQQLLTASR